MNSDPFWRTSSSSYRAVGLVVGIATSLLLLWLTWQQRRRRQLPPGPFPVPVLGNLLELTKSKLPHRHFRCLAQKKYGPIMYLQLGSIPTVVVSSGNIAREFLLTNDKLFASRPSMTATDLLQYGLDNGFSLGKYGPRWREARKLVSLHHLSPKRLAAHQYVCKEELLLLLRDLRARSQAEVDLSAAITLMVENCVCRTLVRRRMTDVVKCHHGDAGYLSLQQMMHEALRLFQVPVFGDFIPFLGILDRATKRSMAEFGTRFDLLWESLLTERQKERQQRYRDKNDTPDDDMLDVLLSNSSLPREAMKACLTDLFAASLDTTSVTLDWTMAELLSNPPTLKKLQAEVQNLVGPHRLVEEDDLAQLPYLSAIIREILRLHPPLPLGAPHAAMEACRIMGGEYSLRKGTTVLINIWAIGRDPQVWSDAEAFLPERFAGAPLKFDVHGQDFDMIPFGTGRRSCPGMPVALPLLQLVVANLAHCFDWGVQGTISMEETAGLVTGRRETLRATPIPRLNIRY